MAGFLVKTKSGSEYRVDYREDNTGLAVLNGGKFVDVDIEKPGIVSEGWPLFLKCANTERNRSKGIYEGSTIRTSLVEHVYPFHDEIVKETENNSYPYPEL